MKKRLFGVICAAVFSFTSVPFAISADETEEQELRRTKSADGSYDCELYNEGNQGEVTFDGAETEGGAFSCRWDGIRNCSFGKGHNIETPDTPYTALGSIGCDYALNLTADGISRFGIHGWMTDLREGFREFPLVEYYIIDGYTEWRPCEGEEPLGQVKDHGCTYDIYAVYDRVPSADMSAQFLARYYSIITEAENPVKTGQPAAVSHQIDVTKHFAAWEKAGMYMGGAIQNVQFIVEGWECAGEAAVSRNEISISSEPLPAVTTTVSFTETGTETTTTDPAAFFGFEHEVHGKAADGIYDYWFWNENDQGDITFDGADRYAGDFSCTWSGVQDCLFRKGIDLTPAKRNYKEFGDITCDYDYRYKSDGVSYYGAYGWIQRSDTAFTEYYIIDGYRNWAPVFAENKLCTIAMDGYYYNVYSSPISPGMNAAGEKITIDRYYSVVTEVHEKSDADGFRTARHAISVDDHFKAWEKAGLDLSGSMMNTAFFIESWECSGEAEVHQHFYGNVDVFPPETGIKGDVNGDSECSAADAELVQKCLLTIQDAALQNKTAADWNGDSVFNAADLSLIKREILTDGLAG